MIMWCPEAGFMSHGQGEPMVGLSLPSTWWGFSKDGTNNFKWIPNHLVIVRSSYLAEWFALPLSVLTIQVRSNGGCQIGEVLELKTSKFGVIAITAGPRNGHMDCPTKEVSPRKWSPPPLVGADLFQLHNLQYYKHSYVK